MQRDTITVERLYTGEARSLELKLVAGANGLKRIIREPTVNRPGLALAGFIRYFASKRLQVIGNAESILKIDRVDCSDLLSELLHLLQN